MTDGVIIKGLDHCSSSGECKDCPANPRVGNFGYCTGLLMKAALDLINRQKAEIERLNDVVIRLQHHSRKLCELEAEMINNIKSEAIKEFAERLKATFPTREDARCTLDDCYTLDIIDRIAEEMTEGDNG